MPSPTMIAAYVALFVVAGAGFLFFNLLVGRFLRPRSPNRDKLEVYECGEPTIGSSHVQFDLRFYVVALLFVIFDVEVALLFPWAVVFGKATHLMDPRVSAPIEAATAEAAPGDSAPGNAGSGNPSPGALPPDAAAIFAELGVPRPETQSIDAPRWETEAGGSSADAAVSPRSTGAAVHALGRTISGMALIDAAIFFAVLAVGFAYVWHRGDLDWVRTTNPSAGARTSAAPAPPAPQPMMTHSPLTPHAPPPITLSIR